MTLRKWIFVSAVVLLLLGGCADEPVATPTNRNTPDHTKIATQTVSPTITTITTTTRTPTHTKTPTNTLMPTAPADELPTFILNYWVNPYPNECGFETKSKLFLLKPPYNHFEDFISYDDANVFFPRLSNDGELLAYVYSEPVMAINGEIPENNGNTSIWITSLDGLTSYKLSKDFPNYDFLFAQNCSFGALINKPPVWSPDDKFISINYLEKSNYLYVVEVETGNLIDIPVKTFTSPVWLNNSRFFVLSGNVIQLVTLIKNDEEWIISIEEIPFIPEEIDDRIEPVFSLNSNEYIFRVYRYSSKPLEVIWKGFWVFDFDIKEMVKMDDSLLPNLINPLEGDLVVAFADEETSVLEFFSKDNLQLVGVAQVPNELDDLSRISSGDVAFDNNTFAWIDINGDSIHVTDLYGEEEDDNWTLNLNYLMPDRLGYIIGIEIVTDEFSTLPQSFLVVPTPTEIVIESIAVGQEKIIPGKMQFTIKDFSFNNEITPSNPDGFYQSLTPHKSGTTLLDVVIEFKNLGSMGIWAVETGIVEVLFDEEKLACMPVFEQKDGRFTHITNSFVNPQKSEKVHYVCEVPIGLETENIPFEIQIMVEGTFNKVVLP